MIPINIVKHSDSVERLEKLICTYTGARYALAITSATAGLFMTLLPMAYGEILVPSYGFPAVWKICELLDIHAVAVEMDYTSMSMDLDDLRKKLTLDTVAIVNVETNGVLGNLNEMKSFAEEHELFFIEDSASSLVQNYNGINAGRFGNAGVYSFSDTKILNSGEGGAIVTDDSEVYKTLKTLRYSDDYSSVYPISMNFNMSYYLADRLLTQFSSIDELSKDRERVHNLYKESGLNIFESESVTNRYQYIMYRSQIAKAISSKLKKLKIGHRYKHYTVVGDCPVANKIKSEVIDLPSFYGMTPLQIKTICDVIRRVERDNI